MSQSVAYQGEPGAFSDDAARALVPGAATEGHVTFDDAFAALERGETHYALLPCENSISGAVPRVYDLLYDDPNITIVDEIVYRVVQNLIGVPGTTVNDLTEVRSHPVALEQCRRFLSSNPHLHVAATADTAGAVREIAALRDRSIGAIASALAAERYGMSIVAPAVQDVENNFTRFFLLERAEEGRPEPPGAPRRTPNRACVALWLADRPGSLRDALSAFADEGLNLRTLVSRPSLEQPFTYRFYCEIAPVTHAKLDASLATIRSSGGGGRVLGFY